MTLVSVCIVTYARPTIRETIDSIVRQTDIAPSEMEIIVCDEDDPEKSSQELIKDISRHVPISIKYLVCGKRSIAMSRNVCLFAATGKWIAFIDDDQTAEQNWLSELISTQHRYEADVVRSYVKAIYPIDAPAWVMACDPFKRDPGPTGTNLVFVSTNGILFRKTFATENTIEFDPNYGKTGGEDADFFFRFHLKGARIVSCRTSVVNEHVPSSRLTKSYLRRRYIGDGYSYGRFFISKLPIARIVVVLAKSAVAVAICLPYPFIAHLNVRVGYKMFEKFWIHLGVLEWAIRKRSFEELTARRIG